MKTRSAVILVAGVGSRLRPLTDDRPKALVDLGGETILARALRLLAEYGVTRAVLATGYREPALREALCDAPIEIVYCANEQYASTQNSVSLARCAGALPGAFFKLDGDLVFMPQVLSRLDSCPGELAVAVDDGRRLDEEAMKVRVDGSRIVAFGKHLALGESAGESIGIERVAAHAGRVLFEALERTIASGETSLYYEDVYSALLARGALDAHAVSVADLPWTEVDDFEDLRRARQLAAAPTGRDPIR